jgi:hypothetical protein
MDSIMDLLPSLSEAGRRPAHYLRPGTIEAGVARIKRL